MLQERDGEHQDRLRKVFAGWHGRKDRPAAQSQGEQPNSERRLSFRHRVVRTDQLALQLWQLLLVRCVCWERAGGLLSVADDGNDEIREALCVGGLFATKRLALEERLSKY